MSGIIGGNNYGGHSYNDSGSMGGKYGSIDNKTQSTTGTYGGEGGLGAYGDYNYNKSTLDKYKDTSKTNTTVTNVQKKSTVQE